MITFTERLDKAIRTAAWAHEQQGQHRKGTDIPYIIHPFGVMIIASSETQDEDTLISCLLHDVLEDVDRDTYSESDMRRDFGDTVTDTVQYVSKDDSIADWRQRSQAYMDRIEQHGNDASLIVCAADKIHNLQSVIIDYRVIGDDVWEKFTTRNYDDQLWWYESIAALLRRKQPELQLTKQLESLLTELQQLIAAR